MAFAIGFGMHGVFEANSTELQREFDINSNELSYVLLMYYTGFTLALPFIAYYGTHSKFLASGFGFLYPHVRFQVRISLAGSLGEHRTLTDEMSELVLCGFLDYAVCCV